MSARKFDQNENKCFRHVVFLNESEENMLTDLCAEFGFDNATDAFIESWIKVWHNDFPSKIYLPVDSGMLDKNRFFRHEIRTNRYEEKVLTDLLCTYNTSFTDIIVFCLQIFCVYKMSKEHKNWIENGIWE